uniref:Uncharacterized protein n=1 Tax=Neovison vison TaxID=452646 RepID=A0A8C7C6A1_NEOVI
DVGFPLCVRRGRAGLTLPSLKPQEQQCKKEEAAGQKDSKGCFLTWWEDLGAGPQGLLQGAVGDLAGVSDACRARFYGQEGGNAVGARCALPEAGEGGARDWDRGSAWLLSAPRHGHVQRIIASDAADEGGWQSFVLQAESPKYGLTLDMDLDDLLSLVQRGGDLTNVGPLVLQGEARQGKGGRSALALGLPPPPGPAVYQLAVALMVQPPLHTGQVQARCHGEATGQGG